MKNVLIFSFLFLNIQFIEAQNWLFYNKGNGATTAVFSCDMSGGSPHALSAGWTHVLHYQNSFKNGGSYFFYNSATGLGVTTADQHQNFETRSITNMSSGWTHVLQIDNGTKILFYNMHNGLLVVTDLNFETIRSWTMTLGTTHIVSTASNVLFYNATTGAGRTMTSDLVFTLATHSMSPGWTHIVNLAPGLFFYNTNTGAGTLANARNMSTIRSQPLSAGWTHIVQGSACPQILFYNANTAAATVTNYNFETVSTHAMSGGWSSILAPVVLL